MAGRSDDSQRLAALVQHFDRAQQLANAGSWEWDIVTNDLIWSPQIFRIFGLAPNAFVPTYPAFLDRVHPDDRHLVENGVADAIEGTRDYETDHRIVLPDGSVRTVHERGEVEISPDGRPIRMLGAVQDVTEARAVAEAARRSQDMLASMLQLLPEAILVCDAVGRIQLFSAGAQAVYGYDPQEMIGLDVGRLVPERFREDYLRQMVRFVDGPGATFHLRDSFENLGQRKNGEEFPTEVSAVKLATDEGYAFTVLVRDLSAWKESERQLIEARTEAERANLAKSAFLANMSHEIRTPLNGVLGVTAALARTELSDRQLRMVELIETSGRALDGLLSDILDLAKVDAGRMVVRAERFDLSELVRDTLGLFRASAAEKGVDFGLTLSAEARGVFVGDDLKIRQILSNLLSNAVKFTDRGVVRVSVAVLNACDDPCRVAVAVEDTGIGFTPELGEALFDRFEQADGSISRRYGGAGLGLAICRSLVELMGGRIEAASRPDHGSRFVFELPLARAPDDLGADRQPLDIRIPTAGPPLKVLLAEDRAINRMTVEMILDGQPVALTCVENGQEAVLAAQAADFDLILMDLQMPVMDGLTAIRRIRGRETETGCSRVPICVLSANVQPEHRESAAAADADGFLTKPIDVSALLELIDRTATSRAKAALPQMA